jgi:Tol biopolymer transport system component
MSKDGADMKTLTEQNLAMSEVAFSPSGQLLSFVMKDATGVDNVFLVGIVDHGVRQLTREGGTGPSWVGDDKVLFAHDDAVYLIGVDGLGLAKEAEVSGSTVFRPSLSPGGATILFSSRTYGNRSSYSVHLFNRADGSMRSLVTEELPSWVEPGWRPEAIWSPTGDEIAFLSYGSGINTILVDGSNRASLKIRGSGMVSFVPAVGR